MDRADPVSPDLRVVFDTLNGTGSGPASFSYMNHADKARIKAVQSNVGGRKGLNVYDDSMRAIDMKADAALTQLKQTMHLEGLQGKALGPHPLNLDKFMAFTLDGLNVQSTLAQANLQRNASTPDQAALKFKFDTDPGYFDNMGLHLQAAEMQKNWLMGSEGYHDKIKTNWGLGEFENWWKSAYVGDMGSLNLDRDTYVRTRPGDSLGVFDATPSEGRSRDIWRGPGSGSP